MNTFKQTILRLLLCYAITGLLSQGIDAQALMPYLVDTLYGYSDIHGQMKIAPSFTKARVFLKAGYAEVEYNGREAIIDTTGSRISMVPGLEAFDGWFDDVNVQGNGTSRFYQIKQGKETVLLDSNMVVALQLSDISGNIRFVPNANYFIAVRYEKEVKEQAVFAKGGRRILPWQAGHTSFYNFPGGTILYRVLGRNEPKQFYNTKRELLSERYYRYAKSIATKKENFLLLLGAEGLAEVRDTNFQLLYDNVDLSAYADEQLFQRALNKGIHPSLLAKIYSNQKGINCWYDEDREVCAFREKLSTGNTTVYGNGKALIHEGEKYLNMRSDLGLVYTKLGEQWGCRTVEDKMVIPHGDYTVGSPFRVPLILVRTKTGVQYHQTTGEKIPGRFFAEATGYYLRKEKFGKMAYHSGDGVPLTGFNYEQILFSPNDSSVFAKREGGYDKLDTLGQVVEALLYDSIYSSGSTRYYLTQKDDKIGIMTKSGEAVVAPTFKHIDLGSMRTSPPPFSVITMTGDTMLLNLEGGLFDRPKEFEKFSPKSYLEGGFTTHPAAGGTNFYNSTGDLLFTVQGGLYFTPSHWKQGFFRKSGKWPVFYNFRNGVIYKSPDTN